MGEPENTTQDQPNPDQTTPPSGAETPAISPEVMAELLELHEAAKRAGMSPAEVHNAAALWTQNKDRIIARQEEQMFSEHGTQTNGKTKPAAAAPETNTGEPDSEDYVTVSRATELAAEAATRVVTRWGRQQVEHQQQEALYDALAKQHGITDPIMKEAVKAYAEKAQQQGLTPPQAYAQFAASQRNTTTNQRSVASAVKNTAAMRTVGTVSGSSGGTVVPTNTAREPADKRFTPDDARKMKPEEAMSKLFSGVRL